MFAGAAGLPLRLGSYREPGCSSRYRVRALLLRAARQRVSAGYELVYERFASLAPVPGYS